MQHQEDYVLRTVEERGVRFVRLWFTDVLGALKSFAITPAELETALEEGMMFGSDYPHVEGTWPRTYDWVRATLGGIPEDEQRLILGGNAARLYGFDLGRLEPIAARVGIPVDDLAERYDHPSLAHTQVDRPGVMLDHV